MDIFLIILGSICLLVGLIGCIVPMLPGPPIAYVALVLLQLTDKVTFTPLQLFFWLFLVVVIQILDYFVPMFGVKRFGGTGWEIGVVLSVRLPDSFYFRLGVLLLVRLPVHL